MREKKETKRKERHTSFFLTAMAAVLAVGCALAVPAWLETAGVLNQGTIPVLQKHEPSLPEESSAAPAEETKRRDVPILLYHNIAQEGADETQMSGSTISQKQFEEEMDLLAEQGFESVSFQDMIDFVEWGKPLPERPVCITFDDGYLSNYKIAYPILKKYQLKATIFAIGSTVGNKTNYKDTDFPITPHFDFEQAKEMSDSGLVSIQTHTYDMHQWAAYESGGQIRKNILPLRGESREDYARFLEADFNQAREEIEAATGQPVEVLAYPGGSSNWLCQELLTSFGVKATLSIHPGKAMLVRERPASLHNMNRFYVKHTTTREEFLGWLA